VRICGDASATSRWAKARINAVDYEVMTGRVNEETGRATIIDLSVTHRVLSKYTAWIAVDTSRTTDSIVPQRVVQPSFAPDRLGASFALHSSVVHSSIARPRLSRDISIDSVVSCMPAPDRLEASIVGQLFDYTGLQTLVDDLRRVLSGGKHHLDWQSIAIVLEELRDWLDDNDESVIGRRTHGKIARRLGKLTTDDVPTPAVQWKVLNELMVICAELAQRSPAQPGKLRSFFA
jgi:hypothetical protein